MWRRLTSRAREVLRSSTGAFNPSSLMIGAVITGILAVGAFLVMPSIIGWANERDARGALDEVRDAQRNALSVERAYLDEDALVDRGYMRNTLETRIQVGGQTGENPEATGNTGNCYVALTTATDGTLYWASDSHEPEELTSSSEPRCVRTSELEALAADMGHDLSIAGGDAVFPPPTVNAFLSGPSVIFNWNDTGASDYLVDYHDGTSWQRIDYTSKQAPNPNWSVGIRSIQVPSSAYPEATDLKVRVASVNADGTTSPTSPVAAVTLRGKGNVLPNPGFERGLSAWHRSNDRAGLTTKPTAAGMQAVRLQQGAWIAPAGVPGPGGNPAVDVTGLVQNSITLDARVASPRDMRVVITAAGTSGGTQKVQTYERIFARTSGSGFEDRSITITGLPPHSDELLVSVIIHGAGSVGASNAAVIDDVELVVDNATVAELDELRGNIL